MGNEQRNECEYRHSSEYGFWGIESTLLCRLGSCDCRQPNRMQKNCSIANGYNPTYYYSSIQIADERGTRVFDERLIKRNEPDEIVGYYNKFLERKGRSGKNENIKLTIQTIV